MVSIPSDGRNEHARGHVIEQVPLARELLEQETWSKPNDMAAILVLPRVRGSR